MGAKIINRGRGPEIEGTRITVFDVLDYRKHGWHRDRIAALLRLSSAQVQAAIDYIDTHNDEVMAAYQRILDRQQNPQEVQALLEASRGAAHRKLAELKARRQANGNGQHADDSR